MYDGWLEHNREAMQCLIVTTRAQSLKASSRNRLSVAETSRAAELATPPHAPRLACGTQKPLSLLEPSAKPLSRGQTRVVSAPRRCCFPTPAHRLLFSCLSRRRTSSLPSLLPSLSLRCQALSDATQRHVDVLQILGRPRVGHVAHHDARPRHAHPRTCRVTHRTSPSTYH